MATSFQSIVKDLWASMGLESPRFRADNSIYLEAEEGSFLLKETEDGRSLLARATIGDLSKDPVRRVEQTRWLLKENLAFVMSRRACVCFDSDADSADRVVAAGVHSYDDGVHALAELVEDVLFLQGRHSGELGSSREAKPRISPERYERQNVIFHP